MSLSSRIPEIAAELVPRLEAAVEAAAEQIAEGARQRVPVLSGRLREAIHVEHDGLEASVVAGTPQVFYGNIVEHGSAHRGAHPFLVPAFEDSRESVMGLLSRALEGL
jgi:HK97 gp10 family phage protein